MRCGLESSVEGGFSGCGLGFSIEGGIRGCVALRVGLGVVLGV